MSRILIIEDDTALNQGIMLALKEKDDEFTQCFTVKEAEKALKVASYDLILLDINLPDGNGFEVCKSIRENSSVPIIILTANDMELDEVRGLELGASDYITKPFSLMVLRARVKVQLRKKQEALSAVFVIDDFKFDFEHMMFTNKMEKVELSKTEQKLLRLLVENKGQVLTRNQLMDRVWSDEAEFVGENALSVTIKRLRDKLENDASKPDYIKTVYGMGYTWAVNKDA